MISDANKGISSVEYNHLNMPTKITVTGSNAGTLDYVYAADRTKLRKINSNGTTTDYIGNFVYEGGSLKQITHPEGYIEPDGTGGYDYVYRYTDIWGNTRLTYADDNKDGSIDPSNEIRREQNYYPFGLEHKGYNGMTYGVENNLKTYQGQEFTKDLGLDVHEWRFRMSDPAIGRFWQIDPLADEYVYNSTYAFQENKLGMGIELEGAELLKRFQDGMSQLKQGVSDLFKNETGKELNRRIESGKTQNAARKEQIQQERLADRSQAMGNIAEGTAEATKGGAQAVGTSLENAGDAVTVVGIATAQPEIIAAGETISNTGTAINATVDIIDGKPLEEVIVEQAPGIALGKLGKAGINSTKKHLGKEAVKRGEANVTESVIKANEKVLEGVTTELIIPAVEEKNDN
jgi:RHS repeat-associated protein